MNADDIAPLLATTPAADTSLPDVGLHIGEVLAWDPATGGNTILLAGTPVTDLPMLNIGDTTNLAVGNTVVVLRSKSAYFILGRVVSPASEVFATSAVEFASRYDANNNYALTTTETVQASVLFDVPPWANRALLTATAHCTGVNSRGVNDLVYAAVWVSTLNGPQTVQGVAPTMTGTASVSWGLSATVTPGSTFDVTARTRTNGGAWNIDPLNRSALSVAAIFTRVPE